MVKTKKYENEEVRKFVFIHKSLIELQDIAKEKGISKVLVSYIINGLRSDYYGVIETAEKQIKTKLEELSIVK